MDRPLSDMNDGSFVQAAAAALETEASDARFTVEPKYNQQNMALPKIKVNEFQPDMENTAILKIQKESVDFILKDLAKDGFDVKAYADNAGSYFIAVDLTGKDVADASLGLAKYYYVKEVLVSRKVYNELFQVSKTADKSKTYAARMGTITGGMNLSPVDLTINKIEWTIKGGINLSPVGVTINHEEKTITGGVNLSPVSLKFEWSLEEVTMEGGANHSPVKYTVNWKKGLLEGYSNHSPLKLEFDMSGDVVNINGYANYAPVGLTFDKVSGELKGGMNRAPVGLKLVNCDLYDFLQYFFLFLK
ncbi:MAG: hypothetical protein COT17_02460 [Elusimicrobia bacterium CG08_land_8_20_14_0_20_51_18]|nr:MAG: hypothetical protein COT17_02460 [Elusimicrobia bacterium CG08_land_8_20_14_0_20_51_18]